MRHWFHSQPDHESGNFRAPNDELLSLFGDPDARGSRRWHEVFGFESTDRDVGLEVVDVSPATETPKPITAPAMPKWSSDW